MFSLVVKVMAPLFPGRDDFFILTLRVIGTSRGELSRVRKKYCDYRDFRVYKSRMPIQNVIV